MQNVTRRSVVVMVLVVLAGCLNDNGDNITMPDDNRSEGSRNDTSDSEPSGQTFIELEAIPTRTPPADAVVYSPDDTVVRDVAMVEELLELVDQKDVIEEGKSLAVRGYEYDSEAGRELRAMFNEMSTDTATRNYYLEYRDWHFLLVKVTSSEE